MPSDKQGPKTPPANDFGADNLRRIIDQQGLTPAAADALLKDSAAQSRRRFDRRTNPLVDEVIARHPHWFDGWMPSDFDDLYSRFGTGGALTWDGVAAAVATINLRREIIAKVALILETGHADALVDLVDDLYDRVVLVHQTQ